MSKVLAVIDRLHFTGFGRALRDLALHHRSMRVIVLEGSAGPWGDQLRAAGIEVECLDWRSTLDAKPWRQLRQQQREWRPDVIHAWGHTAARWVALSGRHGRTVATLRFPPARGVAVGDCLDRWLMRGFDKLIVHSAVEKQRAIERGWDAARLEHIPPSVAVASESEPATIPGVSPTTPVILCVGDLVPARGMYEAIWAFDVLRFIYPDARLTIVGDGPERPRLEKFARDLPGTGGVHFVGEQTDLAPWYARASAVWCTARTESSSDVVLSAMAHGRPVVSYNWPNLAELIDENRTGHLTTVGDKIELARVTRPYLDNPTRRNEVGVAARQVLQRRFANATWLEAWQHLHAA